MGGAKVGIADPPGGGGSKLPVAETGFGACDEGVDILSPSLMVMVCPCFKL